MEVRCSKQGYLMAGPRAVEALRAAVSSDQSKTRQSAALTLGTIGTDAQCAIPELIDAVLHDQNQLVRIYAAARLGRIGPGASQAVEPLLELLRREEDPQVIPTVI